MLKVALINILLFVSSVAVAECKDAVFNSVVEKAKMVSPSRICGKGLGLFVVSIEKQLSSNRSSFNGIRLYINDHKGEPITLQTLQPLPTKSGGEYSACINEKYMASSYLRVFLRKVTGSKDKYSISPNRGKCNLSDIVDLT